MLKIDVSSVVKSQKLLSQFAKEKSEKIVRQTIQQTGSIAKTKIIRNLVGETTLKYGYVKSKITGQMVSSTLPVYQISIRDSYTMLSAFKFRKLKAGVKVDVWSDKGKLHKGAIALALQNGSVQIFKTIKNQRTASGKQKLKTLYGPSLQREAFRGQSNQILQAIVIKEFTPRLERKIAQYIK